MLRFAALGLACSMSIATSALAVPVTFVLSKDDPALIVFQCTPLSTGDDCGLLDPKFAFRDDKNVTADPDATFRILKFKADPEAEPEDSNGGPHSSSKTEDDDEDDDDEAGDILSGTFTATVTLLMKAFGLEPITLTSTGKGEYSTEDGVLKTFSITWSKINNFIVDGAGTFSATFEDIDLVRDSGLDEEEDEDDYKKKPWGNGVYVSATITPVPLPAGAWLLLSGLVVLSAARLRRRAAA